VTGSVRLTTLFGLRALVKSGRECTKSVTFCLKIQEILSTSVLSRRRSRTVIFVLGCTVGESTICGRHFMESGGRRLENRELMSLVTMEMSGRKVG